MMGRAVTTRSERVLDHVHGDAYGDGMNPSVAKRSAGVASKNLEQASRLLDAVALMIVDALPAGHPVVEDCEALATQAKVVKAKLEIAYKRIP